MTDVKIKTNFHKLMEIELNAIIAKERKRYKKLLFDSTLVTSAGLEINGVTKMTDVKIKTQVNMPTKHPLDAIIENMEIIEKMIDEMRRRKRNSLRAILALIAVAVILIIYLYLTN